MKHLNNGNYKIVSKVVKEECRSWKDLPCSGVSRVNIVKIVKLLKVIYGFNAILIKLLVTFFLEI
jgi:hypothetical protein